MRSALVFGLLTLATLAGCGSTRQEDHAQVCQEQSDWAQNGKTDQGEIAISCPAHGVGPYQ